MGKRAPAISARVGKSSYLGYCHKHSTDNDFVVIHPFNICPACEQVDEINDELRELRTKLTQKNKEIKLLKYELVDERKLHAGTRLEVAEYLAQKKLVDNLVKDRLK